MKICVVSTPIFKTPVYGYSGLEFLAYQTAEGLAKLGHQVSLVAPDGSECPGVKIIPVGVERQVDELMAWGGYSEIKEKQGDKEVLKRRKHGGYWQHLLGVDCVIDHSWNKHSYLLKMEGRLKAPVLGVCHAPVNTMMGSLPPVEKPCFVCISEDQKSHFEALFERPARLCYNGIDLDYYRPIDVQRTKRFLFLARFSSVKGPDTAIRVCKVAGVRLDLVGDTSITNEPELLEWCKREADGEQIRMVGPALRGETVYWYSRAHCLIHATQHFREPFGLAPVEAMACGTPVIGWNRGALKETVVHGETGWLVNSEAEMVEAVKGYFSRDIPPVERGRCRDWAGRFSIDKMVKRYDELCHEAVDGGGW